MAWLRDVPGFGALVDWLSWVIGSFDNKDLAFLIALTILLIAVWVWVFYASRRHRRWVKPIRRLSAKLEKLRNNESDADGRLIKAGESFESEATLAPLWRDYRKHLQPNPQTPGYLNLIDPRLWFSVDSLPGRGYEQWCATWAGIFLTVGLLFTFIGLSAALLKVGGIGANSAAMKAAITGILGVSSAKFITSIAGLIGYIGFSLLTRHYQSSQQATARQLADAVQHLSVPLTPELVLHEQNDIARRQLTRMERLTDDLAVALDAKLEQRLKVLAADFGQYLGTIKQDLPSATAHPIVEAIGNMSEAVAREFSNQVQQTAGGEINTVAERFTALANVLAGIKTGMGGMGREFGSEIKAAATSLVEAADRMGKGVQGQSTELEQKIDAFGKTLESIDSNLHRVPDHINNALNTTMSKLTEAVETLTARLAQGGQDGGDALRKGGQQAGMEIEKTVGRAGSEFDRLVTQASGELVKKFAAAQAGLQDAIKDLTSRLQTVESSLKVLPDAVAAQVKHLHAAGQTFMTAGQTVTGASGALQQATQPLQQTAAALRTSVDQIRDGVEKAAATHRHATESSQLALNGLRQAAAAAEQTFKSHVERFGRVDEELAKALTTLRAGVEQVAKETQKVFNEYDTHITKAANSLGTVAADLQEAAVEIGESVKQLAEARQQPRRPY
ncbi:MAG: hypothetical protein P9F75_03555 [Candidatus Contendobacter sp.]|nr:hypothetical protein [Candidatus Contendobacter sp.]